MSSVRCIRLGKAKLKQLPRITRIWVDPKIVENYRKLFKNFEDHLYLLLTSRSATRSHRLLTCQHWGDLCLRSPHEVQHFVGALWRKKWKENYEKSSIDIISKSVRIWRSIIACGLLLPTIGRDPPLSPHRLWRDTHLQRESDRDRLQVPLSRVIIYLLLAGKKAPTRYAREILSAES